MTTATEPRIDVERLAKALPTVFRAMMPASWKPDPGYDRAIDRAWAAAIAAEYERLGRAGISAADDPSPGYIFTGPTEGGVGSE